MLNIWVILLVFTKVSLSFNLFDGRFYFFSMSLICFITLFMLWPFHCFYYNLRKSIIFTLVKNFLPFGKTGVRFRDFMFGDILTSMTRPFASLCISICLLTCRTCRDENIRGDCNRNSIAAFVMMLLPFVIRFFQCLNRYHYTQMPWPHIGNAIKYCGGMSNVIFSWLYSVNPDKYFLPWIIIAFTATSYMLFWDIYMDWNLGRLSSKNFFLRDNIVYPKWLYWMAIVVNSFLRFTWLTSLPGVDLPVSDESKYFMLSVLEVYRRSQWSLFRIENENTNNPEKYRSILDIPELPLD